MKNILKEYLNFYAVISIAFIRVS